MVPPAARDGTGRPGATQFEGSQSPSLAIEKTAPAEIQVGKPATFVIRVKNTGLVAAKGVQIHDEVPQGTQLISTKPPAHEDASGGLVWDLGPMRPGDEATVELQLMPQAEGEIGSVATVHFQAAASVRTLSTKPALALEIASPGKVLVGDPVSLKIKLSNPGTGAATGVAVNRCLCCPCRPCSPLGGPCLARRSISGKNSIAGCLRHSIARLASDGRRVSPARAAIRPRRISGKSIR